MPKKGGEHHLSKKVKQYDLNGKLIKKWECARDIERELGFKHSVIAMCCNNKLEKAYGYKWEYSKYIEADKIKDKIQELEQNKEDYHFYLCSDDIRRTVKNILQELLNDENV